MPGKELQSRPKRSSASSDQKREILLSIAAELFLAQGYAAVSVDEIIQKASQSKTNVYSWFGGKSGLFLATVDKLCAEVLAPLATLNCAGAPLRQGLCEIAEILLTAIATKRAVALHRLVVAEAVAFPKIAEKWNSDGPERVYQILAHFIEWHQRAGNLTVEDPMLLARQLYNLLTGDLERRLLLGLTRQLSKKKLIELITPSVDMFLNRYEKKI